MTTRLYLETNFLLSHAHGRDPATSRLIRESFPQLQVALPACCVMEALTHLEAERKRINSLLGGNRMQSNELGRNLASPHAARLAEWLLASEPEWELELAFFESRLLDAIRWCSDPSSVTFLPTPPDSLAQISLDPTLLDPTDGLILATILSDARAHQTIPKSLVTENRRCFHDDADVRRSLAAVGVRYFASVTNFLQWYAAQAESLE